MGIDDPSGFSEICSGFTLRPRQLLLFGDHAVGAAGITWLGSYATAPTRVAGQVHDAAPG